MSRCPLTPYALYLTWWVTNCVCLDQTKGLIKKMQVGAFGIEYLPCVLKLLSHAMTWIMKAIFLKSC